MMINIALPGLLDAIMHVVLAAIAMTILFHKKTSPFTILLISIIMEVITDGAHIVNKNYTHNIFFFIELPLMIMLAGYITNKGWLESISLLMLAANITHLIMDAAIEGGTLALYYPVYSGVYSWDFTVLGSKILGGLTAWIGIIMAMKLTMIAFKNSTPLQFPPLFHNGR
ncbi:MAG: hypothetical protein GXO25_03120 [Euryarchaeota archaeon]|nr:hypothetical protein [Euryarchaeota archaeon]